jgi:hypothetical protein
MDEGAFYWPRLPSSGATWLQQRYNRVSVCSFGYFVRLSPVCQHFLFESLVCSVVVDLLFAVLLFSTKANETRRIPLLCPGSSSCEILAVCRVNDTVRSASETTIRPGNQGELEPSVKLIMTMADSYCFIGNTKL